MKKKKGETRWLVRSVEVGIKFWRVIKLKHVNTVIVKLRRQCTDVLKRKKNLHSNIFLFVNAWL